MLSAWLNDMSYDMAISFYRRLNICLNQTLSSSSGKLPLKLHACLVWGRRKMPPMWANTVFLMGNGPFRLYPPFTCRLHHQREKNPPFSPPSACCEEKKEWRDAIFSFSSSHLHPRVSRKGSTRLEDKKGGGGGGGVSSQATWEQDISRIKPLPSLQILYLFSLEEGNRMDSQDRCGGQRSHGCWRSALNSSSDPPVIN